MATVVWQRSEAGRRRPPGERPRSARAAILARPKTSRRKTSSAIAPRLAANAQRRSDRRLVGLRGRRAGRASVDRKRRVAASAPEAEISDGSPDIMRPGRGASTAPATRRCSGRARTAPTIVQFAGYDAFAPELRGLSIPSTGRSETRSSSPSAPFDVWPIGAAELRLRRRRLGPPATPCPTPTRRPASTRSPSRADRRRGHSGERRRNDLDRASQRLLDRQAEAQPQEGNGQADGDGAGARQAGPLRQGGQEGDQTGGQGRRRDPADQGRRGRPASASTSRGDLKLKISIAFTPDGGSTAVRKKQRDAAEKHG